MDASHAGSSPGARPLVRVLCVDDTPNITRLLRLIIDAQPDMTCVGCLPCADRLKEEAIKLLPDVIVLDASMPGKCPLDVMKWLSHELPDVKALMFSGHDDAEFIDAATDAGAWACVSKLDNPEILLEAVRRVATGKKWSRYGDNKDLDTNPPKSLLISPE